MRTGFSLIESPAGFDGTASKLRPLSAASFCRMGNVDAFAVTYIVPLGYVLPLAVTGDFSQNTSSFALSSRFTATNASFISWLRR